MFWFFLAVLAHCFFALTNIVDARLQRNLLKNGITQLFLGSVFAVIALTIVVLVFQPALPPVALWGWALMGGLFALVYLFPYFMALQGDESSVVISYFSLGKIFVPILSFFILGEQLGLLQYAGFGIVLAGSFLLQFRPNQPTHLKPLMLMMLSSLILALHYIAYKHVFNEIGWLSGFTWGLLVGSLIVALILWTVPGQRKLIREDLVSFKGFAPTLFLSFLFGAVGTVIMTYAINLSSPTLVSAFSPFQPFLVFFIGLVLSFFIKDYQPHEIPGRHNILIKFFSFFLMGAGILLVLFG